MKNLIFVDESGDLGLNGSDYFILSFLIFENGEEYNKLRYIFKKARRHKFSKYLKNKNEIKGYKSSDKLIYYLFNQSNKIRYKTFSIVMNKKEFKNKQLIKTKNVHGIYLELIHYFFKKIDLPREFDLKFDKFISPRNEECFNKELLKIIEKNFKKSKFNQVSSEKWKGIQFVDLIAWSSFQKFENGKSIYLEKIENKNVILKF